MRKKMLAGCTGLLAMIISSVRADDSLICGDTTFDVRARSCKRCVRTVSLVDLVCALLQTFTARHTEIHLMTFRPQDVLRGWSAPVGLVSPEPLANAHKKPVTG